MIGFLFILCACALITAIFLLFQALGGRAMGARIEEVSFFFGRIFSFRAANIRFTVGFLPIGGSVQFSGEFQGFHPARKIAIAGCGLCSYAIIALVGLGFNGALHSIVTGYAQLLSGAMSPLGTGSKLVVALASVFQNDYPSGLGILAAKFFAFNSLPLGALSGGFVVLCLLEAAGLKSQRFAASFHMAGFAAIFLLSAAWAIALLKALGRVL